MSHQNGLQAIYSMRIRTVYLNTFLYLVTSLVDINKSEPASKKEYSCGFRDTCTRGQVRRSTIRANDGKDQGSTSMTWNHCINLQHFLGLHNGCHGWLSLAINSTKKASQISEFACLSRLTGWAAYQSEVNHFHGSFMNTYTYFAQK